MFTIQKWYIETYKEDNGKEIKVLFIKMFASHTVIFSEESLKELRRVSEECKKKLSDLLEDNRACRDEYQILDAPGISEFIFSSHVS